MAVCILSEGLHQTTTKGLGSSPLRTECRMGSILARRARCVLGHNTAGAVGVREGRMSLLE
jgi:hypothetical protein